MSPVPPATRFAAIVEGLCAAVAEACARILPASASPPLVILLYSRLRRAAARFAILAAQPGAPARPAKPRTRPREFRAARPDFPRGFAWLLAPVPEAAAASAQLRHFLSEPGIVALLESDPRFARLLRPIGRALGVRLPESLRLPARPPRPASPPRIRIRTRMNRPPTRASLRKARAEERKFLKTIPADWLPGKFPPPPQPPPRPPRTPGLPTGAGE